MNSSKPVLLVGLVQQAETSIENTAQYAGMAGAAAECGKGAEQHAGRQDPVQYAGRDLGHPGRTYMNNALADLCEVKDRPGRG